MVTQLNKLENENPDKAIASHMLVKSLVHVTRGRKDAGLPGYEAPLHVLAQGIISARCVWWAE